MSGATPELNLATAVDADDLADYLTISDAQNMRTLDALFNSVTGHSHSGAHQGGKLGAGSVDASAIADGSITGAKLATGTVTAEDIAPNSLTALLQANGIASAPSTSSATFVDMPDMYLAWTAEPGEMVDVRFHFSGIATPGGALGLIQLSLVIAGVAAATPVVGYLGAQVGYGTVSLGHLFQVPTSGSVVLKAQWMATGGTLNAHLSYRTLMATRHFR